MKDMLYAVLALITAALALGSFFLYRGSNDQKMYLGAALVFVVLTIVFGGLFLSGRVNKGEDIHITE